jgi:hypothetical protein
MVVRSETITISKFMHRQGLNYRAFCAQTGQALVSEGAVDHKLQLERMLLLSSLADAGLKVNLDTEEFH